MSLFSSYLSTKFNSTPPGSFQYNFPSKMQNIDSFYLRNLSLVLSIRCKACRCCNIKMISVYHGDDIKRSPTEGPGCLWGFFSSANDSEIMCRMRASQLDWAIRLAIPWSFINFLGLISRSYSSRIAIHFPLCPLGSGWVRMSFRALVGTWAMMWECRMYTRKSFKACTRA